MNAVMERVQTRVMHYNSGIPKYQTPKKTGVNRAEIWLVKFDGVGSEQQGVRPALIISNQKGNKYGTTVIVAAVTSQIQKAKLPTHVVVRASENGLLHDSVIMLEQVRTVDKCRLIEKVAIVDEFTMQKVKKAHEISCSEMFV